MGHRVFAIASDGDLMEGVTGEAAPGRDLQRGAGVAAGDHEHRAGRLTAALEHTLEAAKQVASNPADFELHLQTLATGEPPAKDADFVSRDYFPGDG